MDIEQHFVSNFKFTERKRGEFTDCALIIDAMDLLHSGTLDGFCLISSDSDFTRLASRFDSESVGLISVIRGIGFRVLVLC